MFVLVDVEREIYMNFIEESFVERAELLWKKFSNMFVENHWFCW